MQVGCDCNAMFVIKKKPKSNVTWTGSGQILLNENNKKNVHVYRS